MPKLGTQTGEVHLDPTPLTPRPAARGGAAPTPPHPTPALAPAHASAVNTLSKKLPDAPQPFNTARQFQIAIPERLSGKSRLKLKRLSFLPEEESETFPAAGRLQLISGFPLGIKDVAGERPGSRPRIGPFPCLAGRPKARE